MSTPKTLRSLDLFSGIGGMTYALRGLGIAPVAYCEKDPDAAAVLQARMRTGDIPTAPIHADVQTLRLPKAQRVHIILAGFPCVGLSRAGHQEKFGNPQTALFQHIVRLVDDLRPGAVFLENVAHLCADPAALDSVLKPFHTRGYDLRWVSLYAYNVGVPHSRRRWFCLALKPGAPLVLPPDTLQRPPPLGREPPRMLKLTQCTQAAVRAGLLGNSVVPQCVRKAFTFLARPGHPEDRGIHKTPPYTPTACRGAWAAAAGTHKTSLHPPPGLRTLASLKAGIILDPAAYAWTGAVSRTLKPAGVLTAPCSLTCWATPRHSQTRACRVLTQRSSGDLPTQLRFERGTPAALRHGIPNPLWIEWLMGFPAGWTKK